MLKRGDLAKQFELVVQQEIKNHNDQMLATNVSINEIRECLEKFKIDQEKNNSGIKSFIDKNKEYIKDIYDSLAKIGSLITRTVDTSKIHTEKIFLLVAESSSLIKNLQVENERLKARISFLESKSNELDKGIHATQIQTLAAVEKAKLSLSKEIERSRQEILSLPSEAQAVKKELEEKMAIDRVDFSGLIKEIQILKKEKFIQEKKIEHLYILIERLEKKVVK